MTKQSILLVDDEDVLRLSLQTNLRREGFEVVSTENAETALTVLKHQSYDLLLTDYLMETVNGLELMQQAKKLYPEIKVVVFSGYADKNTVEKIIRLGADAFFCKPIGFDNLIELITQTLASYAPEKSS